MKPGLTEIVAIVDRSGSMRSIAADMEGGYTQFIESQAKLPGECRVTLVTFDSKSIDKVFDNVPAAEATKFELHARSYTPLLDAIGTTIVSVGERYAAIAESERPEKVVVLIITDGKENASKEYTRKQVADLITHQTEVYKWEFIYLGANVDAFAEANALGIALSNAAAYVPDAAGVGSTFDVLRSATERYRGGGSLAFVADERNKLDISTHKVPSN